MMLFIIKLYARNNVKICQFWGWEFMSLSQKYEERVHKSSFIARHHFKAELSRYISLSSVNICVVVITTATIAVTWCSGHHYCIISFNKAWTKALCRFKSWSRLEIRLNAFRRSTIRQKQFINSSVRIILDYIN